MAIREIRRAGDPVLRKTCKAVPVVNDRIRTLLDDMMDTLHATDNGAALAANQVGLLRRLVVVDMDGCTLKMVNPVIVESSGRRQCTEGCLSVPGHFGETLRPEYVAVEYLDENGEKQRIEARDELAKCFCHELDHLDGILFTDIEIHHS